MEMDQNAECKMQIKTWISLIPTWIISSLGAATAGARAPFWPQNLRHWQKVLELFFNFCSLLSFLF